MMSSMMGSIDIASRKELIFVGGPDAAMHQGVGYFCVMRSGAQQYGMGPVI